MLYPKRVSYKNSRGYIDALYGDGCKITFEYGDGHGDGSGGGFGFCRGNGVSTEQRFLYSG